MAGRKSKKSQSNLRQMSLSELVGLRDEVQALVEKKILAEREELRARMEALTAYGASAERGRGATSTSARGERRGRKTRKAHPLKGTKAPAKYAGPQGETWSGRGLTPRWLVALEKEGKKREQFLVGASTRKKAARHR